MKGNTLGRRKLCFSSFGLWIPNRRWCWRSGWQRGLHLKSYGWGLAYVAKQGQLWRVKSVLSSSLQAVECMRSRRIVKSTPWVRFCLHLFCFIFKCFNIYIYFFLRNSIAFVWNLLQMWISFAHSKIFFSPTPSLINLLQCFLTMLPVTRCPVCFRSPSKRCCWIARWGVRMLEVKT